ESSSSSCGPPVRFKLLATPPHDDAGTFNYRALAYPDTDFHRAVCAPSWAHWELACKRTNPQDLQGLVAVPFAGRPTPTGTRQSPEIRVHNACAQLTETAKR